MIKVNKQNYFKVLKPELFNAGEKLLGEYELNINNSFKDDSLRFYKSFGATEDYEFETFNGLCLEYRPKTQILNLQCFSYGGICGFTFNENSADDENLSYSDKECIKFTINMIRKLIINRVIEYDEINKKDPIKVITESRISTQEATDYVSKLFLGRKE